MCYHAPNILTLLAMTSFLICKGILTSPYRDTIGTNLLVRTADIESRTEPMELSVFVKLASSHCEHTMNILLKVRLSSEIFFYYSFFHAIVD